MNLASGEQLLTLKDVAAAIAFDKSEIGVSRIARQVRHWTQSDLLRPVTRKNTGTGIPRLYPAESTVQVAAVMLELSRYGATVDILKPVADALYDEYDEGMGRMFLALADEGTINLQVAWQVDSMTGKFVNATINFFSDIDMLGEDNGEIDNSAPSSIVINLNKLFDRIPWRTL